MQGNLYEDVIMSCVDIYNSRDEVSLGDFYDIAKWELLSNPAYTSKEKDKVNTHNKSSLKLSGIIDSSIESQNIEISSEPMTGIELSVFVKNSIAVSTITLYLTDTDSNTFFASFSTREINEEWNTLSLSLANFVPLSETQPQKIGKINKVKISVGKQFNILMKDYECSFDSLLLISSKNGNVIFTADDGWDTQYTMYYDVLKRNGLKGNIAVISENVGGEVNVTLEQLKEMYDYGIDLINHTASHKTPLILLSEDQQKQQFEVCKNYLIDNGFLRTPDCVAYPYGIYNSTTLKVLKDNGYIWARTVRLGTENNAGRGDLEVRIRDLVPDISPEKAISYIRDAIDTANTIVFMNHRFTENDDDLSDTLFWKKEWFEELCEFVRKEQDKGTVNVLTISQLVS